MFKTLKILSILSIAWMPLPLAGMTLDLNLSDDAAEFKYATPTATDKLELQVGWLHEEQNGDLAHVGLHMVDDALPGSDRLDIGIGGRLFAMEVAGDTAPDGAGLAVGGYFRYTFPRMDRLGVGGELYYAPSVVSSGDLESHAQWAVRGEYQILRQANVYLGYRRVRPEFEDGGSVTFESGLHVGLRLDF